MSACAIPPIWLKRRLIQEQGAVLLGCWRTAAHLATLPGATALPRVGEVSRAGLWWAVGERPSPGLPTAPTMVCGHHESQLEQNSSLPPDKILFEAWRPSWRGRRRPSMVRPPAQSRGPARPSASVEGEAHAGEAGRQARTRTQGDGAPVDFGEKPREHKSPRYFTGGYFQRLQLQRQRFKLFPVCSLFSWLHNTSVPSSEGGWTEQHFPVIPIFPSNFASPVNTKPTLFQIKIITPRSVTTGPGGKHFSIFLLGLR